MPTHWHPTSIFSGQHRERPYAIIVLNQLINNNALDAVITNAALLVCADGGANRFYEYEAENGRYSEGVKGVRRQCRLPDAIIGDLDSLNKDVQRYYTSQGVEIVDDPDQYSTDFTKCLKFIRQWAISRSHQSRSSYEHDEGDMMDVVVLGGLGGRVDQGFSQIHHLFMAENDAAMLKGRIYLLSEQSLSFVLSASPSSDSATSSNSHGDSSNTNMIHLEPGYFAENVGILPILGRTLLTTRGLEWDVEKWPTEFGGQLSTSNHIRADKIEIGFAGPRPLFTLELEKRLSASGE